MSDCKHDWSKEQDPGYRFCTKCNINYWDGHKMTEKDYKLKKLEKENKELTAQNEDYEKLGMEHIRVVKENKILREIAEKIEHEYNKDPDFRSFFLLENIRSFAQDKLKEIDK